jgi:hypothetical protein
VGLVAGYLGEGVQIPNLYTRTTYYSRPGSAWAILNKVKNHKFHEHDKAEAFKYVCFIQVFIYHLVICERYFSFFIILQRLLNNDRIVGSDTQNAWGNKNCLCKFGLENSKD